MKTVAIIPARLDSVRLPNKHLIQLNGKPLIGYLVERLSSVKEIDDILIATTARKEDDPLIQWAKKNGISYWRGSLTDVLGRFTEAARSAHADLILRINGDSPLIAPEAIRMGIDQVVSKKLGFVTGKNKYTGLPIGLAPEFIRFKVLDWLSTVAVKPEDREHITSYIFSHSASFLWEPLDVHGSWKAANMSLVVDTPEDFAKLQKLIDNLPRGPVSDWTIEEIVQVYQEVLL